MIEYQEKKELKKSDLKFLYSNVGWTSYTQDMDKLERAIQNSLFVLTAWEKDKLIGLIRVVGDGETILYIQDILVHSDFQNRQIGTTLMKQVLSKFKDIRQKTLLTEDAPDVRHFYEKFGFSSCDKGSSVAFFREY